MKGRNTSRKSLARQTALLAVTILLGGVAACAARATSSSSSQMAVEPALGQVTRVTDWHQIKLPLDAWTLSMRDRWRIDRAEAKFTKSCMARFGFSYGGGTSGPEPSANESGITHYRLYGLLDEAHARAYGYHNGETRFPERFAGDSRPISRDYANVVAAKLGGGTYQGQPIPSGGCIGEARRLLAGAGPAVDPSLAEGLGGDSWLRSNSDPRVLAAFHTWSRCMAGSGYSYKNPMDANNDDRWGADRSSKAEIAVALADVRCKKWTNLTGIRMAVDSAYQRAAILAHAQELRSLQERQQRQVRTAVQVLAIR